MTEDVRNDLKRAIDRLYDSSMELAAKTNEYFSAKNRQLTAELEQVKRERDAAVRDLSLHAPCVTCKHYDCGIYDSPCRECSNNKKAFAFWQWRGVQENGGAE